MSTKRAARFALACVTVLPVAALWSSATLAQEASSSAESPKAEEQKSTAVIEEVTVTARRTKEDLLAVPVTITAVTSEALEVKGIEDREALNRFTPGFTIPPQNTSAASRVLPSYQMRGLGAVNVFWNSVAMGSGDFPEMLDLERVEVLKGPQNAYFGRSTFSGALNLVPKLADFDFGGYGQVEAGQYGTVGIKGAIQGTLIDEKLAGRIAVSHRENGGQYKNFGYGGTLGDRETEALAVSLLYTPIEDLDIRVYYSAWAGNDGPNAISYLLVQDYNCNAGGAPAGTLNFICGELDEPRADRISQRVEFPAGTLAQLNALTSARIDGLGPNWIMKNGVKLRGQIGQLMVDYHLPQDWTASLVASRIDSKRAQIFDYGSRYYLYPDGSPDPYTYNPSIAVFRNIDDYFELRLASDANRPLRGLIGVSYVDSFGDSASVISKSGTMSVSGPPRRAYGDTLGVFGSLSYDFGRLTTTVEGRWQKDTFGGYTFGVNNDQSGTTESFVPRVIAQFHFNDTFNAYASYAKGSRPGQVNTGYLNLSPYARQQIDALYDVPATIPEQELDNYELGIKGTFLDGTLQVMGAIYYGQWTGQPNGAGLFYTTPEGVLAQANVLLGTGATDAKGTEWEAVWAATDKLVFDATFAYNKTEVVETNCTVCRQITGNNNPVGNESGRFPTRTASLGVNYHHPAFGGMEAFYRFDTAYQGKMYSDQTNVAWLKPYVTSNLRIGLRNDQYRVELYGVNVFGEETSMSIAQTQEQIAGRPTITTRPPIKATFGVRVGVDF